MRGYPTLYRLSQAETDFVETLSKLDGAIAKNRWSELKPNLLNLAEEAVDALLDVRRDLKTGRYWKGHMFFLALYGLCERFADDASKTWPLCA